MLLYILAFLLFLFPKLEVGAGLAAWGAKLLSLFIIKTLQKSGSLF